MTAPTVDVLVVGAGPTGLLLAGDLLAAGVSVAVVERRRDESNLTRAFAVNPRTLELLDTRGLADELVATGAKADVLRLFGNVKLPLGQLPTRFPFLLITPQYQTERVLADRLAAVGGVVEAGAEVVGLRQDSDGVDVDVRGGDGRLGSPPGSRSSCRSVTATTGSSPGTGTTSSRTRPRSRFRRSARSPGRPWGPTSGCTTRGGCPASTVTSGRFRVTGWAGCSSPATPRTCIRRHWGWA